MIDENGYRENVGIILTNDDYQVFWGKRVRQNAWQFPQGGLMDGETPEQAMYRELKEEVGLNKDQVEIVDVTNSWMRYTLPRRFMRKNGPYCIGQKQKWYLLRLLCSEEDINLFDSEKPEFDSWQWVTYWFPLSQIVNFKKDVYRRALKELSMAFFKVGNKQQVNYRKTDKL